MQVESKPSKPRWTIWEKLVVIACVGVILLVLVGPVTTHWDGRISSIAGEFTFLDDSGNPVPGVMLQVVDDEGNAVHHRPIADFYPGSTPTSDENGVLRFHCLAHRTGGGCREYLFVIETGDCDPPTYTCRFELDGKSVASVPFDELAYPENRDELPKVTRILTLPEREAHGRDVISEESLVEKEDEFILSERTIEISQ